MTDYRGLITTLAAGRVEFILVGGLAAVLHGSLRGTNDVDVLYRRERSNMEKLAAALSPLHPKLRGAPPDVPFGFDAETLKRGLNFTFTTDIGDIDLIGEMAGVGGYEQALPNSPIVEVQGISCRCIDLETLIKAKRAAGRRKDLEALVELEALWERGRQRGK